MRLSWLSVGLTWLAQTTVRLRHDLTLGCEEAVRRMQLHCTIATSLNTGLTAMCPVLRVRPRKFKKDPSKSNCDSLASGENGQIR